MVDVHDIDALLISALYGELTPADEARLAAHLESHPTDRTALADLTHARSLVKDSRILTFQYDPPQAVSALLLQEAARRAPAVRRAPALSDEGREGRESWFFRFVRTFTTQPAMAAAAMLVLVVGAAGVLKMRDRGDFAEVPVEKQAKLATPTVADPMGMAAPATESATETSAAAPTGTAAVAQDFQLRGGPGANNAGDETRAAAGSAAGYTVGLTDALEKKLETPSTGMSYKSAPAAKPVAPPGHGIKDGISVTTPTLGLKEDDDRDVTKSKGDVDTGQRARGLRKSAEQDEGAPGGAVGGAATPPPPTVAPPPPPPVAPQPVQQSPQQSPAKSVDHAPVSDKLAPPTDGPSDNRRTTSDPALVAWAAGQLQQVVALAKDNKCDDAAKLAAAISVRAPDYYAQNVATNIELKQCMAYISAAQDRAEKAAAQKQRAASKRSDTTAK